MSIHTVERVLYDIASSPDKAAAYKADAAKFLASYPLETEEAQMVLGLRFRELTDRGLNHMLAMRAFSALQGRDKVPDYLRELKG